VGSADISSLLKQKSSVTGVGFIGIITLPAEGNTGNGLKDFKLNDKGCLPILALQTAAANGAIGDAGAGPLASISIAYSIGRTCASVSANGQCTQPATFTFGISTDGCLSGMAGGSGFNAAIKGETTLSETSGTAQTLNTGTTHIKQKHQLHHLVVFHYN